jgi:hypothetical protein
MKPMNVVRKYGSKFGRSPRAQIAAGTALASVSSFSNAAASFDSTEAVGWIAAAVVIGGILLAAMFGLVTMIGAGKKAQRAGT